MRRFPARTALRVAGIAAVVLVSFSLMFPRAWRVATRGADSYFTGDVFNYVSRGDTEAAALAKIGLPPGDYHTLSQVAFHFENPFVKYPAYERRHVWVTNRRRVVIDIGTDGRVVRAAQYAPDYGHGTRVSVRSWVYAVFGV